jgi:exonuclease SbcC
MKINSLKFKNINSLAGENSIDFTRPEFTENGIFAITGKTGAGKSSILDAVTLALYGRTPRVDVTGAANDVMTRGTTDCYAEIEFETGSQTWIATWKQELTRTGNLKPVQRAISDSEGRIVADRIAQCDAKIVDILGLTFEQFTKVILLAQGSFAAFLQADKTDKGELLEQITGTEIYGEISRRVFERSKREKEKLEQIILQIGEIKILNDEEILNLQTENAGFEKQNTLITNELKALDKAIKWLSDIAVLKRQIAETEAGLPDLEEQAKQSGILVEKHKELCIKAKAEKEAGGKILIEVRKADTRISEKTNQLNPLADSLKILKIELEKSVSDLDTKNKRLSEAQISLEKQNRLLTGKTGELTSKKTELSILLNGRQLDDWQKEKEKTVAFGICLKSLIDNLKEIISSKAEVAGNEKLFAENSAKEKEISAILETDRQTAEIMDRQIALLQENITLLRTVQSLEEHRKNLEDGKPCPLCGAVQHPYAQGNIPQSGEKENELRTLKQQFAEINQRISANGKALAKIQSDAENAVKNRQQAETKLLAQQGNKTVILAEIAKFERKLPEIAETENTVAKLDEIRILEQGKYKEISSLIDKLTKTEAEIANLRDVEIVTVNTAVEAEKSRINTLKVETSGLTIAVVEKQKQIKEKSSDIERLEAEKRLLLEERRKLFGDKTADEEENRLKKLVSDAENALNVSETAAINAGKALAERKAVILQNKELLQSKEAEKITEKTIGELQAEYELKSPQSTELLKKTGANLQALEANRQNLERNRKKLAEKAVQQRISEHWKSLDALIGSADGKKYRNFAQALTFENLISLANRQLQKMSDRYILKRVGNQANPFELSVIDKFQNCEERTAQNLSGGEKFIVSLALALGLSGMASRNMRIDTMFIDEGFGTLDADYLDVALNALSNLQNEGKLIGVISHLTELKERIATHIEVTARGDGSSKIEIKCL